MAGLTGQELVYVVPVLNGIASPLQTPVTTAQIGASSAGVTTTTTITAIAGAAGQTVTAAAIFGKISNRTGQTAAVTDTTDTALNIIASMGTGAVVGGSIRYVYENSGNFPITLAGGTGVTVSGITIIPANSWAEYVVTEATATTVTIIGYAAGNFISVGTFTANGVTPVVVANAKFTATSAVDITLKTIGGTPAGPFLVTATPGTGFNVQSAAGDTSVYNYAITN